MNNNNTIKTFWSVFDETITLNFKPISIKEGQKVLDLAKIQPPEAATAEVTKPPQEAAAPDEVKLTCITAPGETFSSEAERIAHYKTDWHLYNLKLKSAGLPLLTKEQYLLKVANGGGAEDLTTIEEDESEEEQVKPLVGSNRIKFITGDSQEISLWKNLLVSNPNDRVVEMSQYVRTYLELPSKQNWAIFMSSGGRFAGATFQGKVVKNHKTFVRYTVRKKQGGSQSSKDNQSGTSAPKSAGATMRRYNEKRFREQILEVISNWDEELKNCHLIFLSAPGINWNYFFARPSGFNRGDSRIRSVPFNVSRPTLDEVKRIHHILSTIEVLPHDPSSDIILVTEEPSEPAGEPLVPSVIEEVTEKVKEEDLLSLAIINGDLTKVISLFESDYEIPIQTDVDKIRTPVFLAVEHNQADILAYLLDLDTGDIDSPIPGWLNRTALHRAVIDENTELIPMLLNAGADPASRDLYGQTPYVIASKNIRTFIRKFAGDNPDMHNWNSLGIVPLTDEQESEQKKKNAEKKERKKQNLKKKKQEQKEEELRLKEQKRLEAEKAEREKQIAQVEGFRTTKMANLSDREKRALAAEARILASKGTGECCAFCKKPLTTIPFERLKYKYCSVECVTSHMDEL